MYCDSVKHCVCVEITYLFMFVYDIDYVCVMYSCLKFAVENNENKKEYLFCLVLLFYPGVISKSL